MKSFVTGLIFSIFTSLQVGKYAGFCMFSNKRRASNKHLPLISPAPNSFNF